MTGKSVLSSFDDIERFSQELRLAFPITRWVDATIGGFYTDAESPLFLDLWGVEVNGAKIDNGFRTTLLANDTFREASAFANLTFKLTDRLDVQIGGRQSSMKQTYQVSTVRDSVFGIPVGPGPTNRAEPDAFTYLFAPHFKLSPDLMIYARLASGYRVGGTNDSIFCNQGYFPCGYDPDKSKNYEVGLKGNYFGRVLSVDASIYSIDWDGIQIGVIETLSGSGFRYVANAGKARSRGVELSMEVRPRNGLTMAGWIAWNNAEIAENVPSQGWLKGDRLQYGTDWTGRLSVNQSFSLPGNLSGFVEGAANYVGEREAGVGEARLNNGVNNYPDYTKYDLSAGVRWGLDWSANLFVTNVTDERGSAQGNPVLRPTQVIYIQPRTVGISLTREF